MNSQSTQQCRRERKNQAMAAVLHESIVTNVALYLHSQRLVCAGDEILSGPFRWD